MFDEGCFRSEMRGVHACQLRPEVVQLIRQRSTTSRLMRSCHGKRVI